MSCPVSESTGEQLWDLFASIWTQIRSSHLAAGQPRGDRSSEGVSLAQQAISISSTTGDPMLSAEAHRMMAYVLNANEQYEDSITHYQHALKTLDATEGKQDVAARTRLGLIAALLMSGRYVEAIRIGAMAHEWFAANNDRVGLAKLYTNLGNVCHRMDDHAQSLDYHEKAKAIFKTNGDNRALAMSMLNMANALSSLDRFVESDHHYAAAERLSRRMDMPELRTQAKYNRAYLHFLRGRFSDALKAFASLRRQFKTQQSLRHAALCDLDEAEIYLQLNASRDAATLAERAMNAFKELGMRYEHAKAMAFLGVATTQKSEWTDASAIFRQAQLLFEEERNEYWTALLDLYRAEIFFSSRRLWEAQSLAESARERFVRAGVPSKHVLCLTLLGRIATDLNQQDASRQYSADALRLAREHKMPLLLFRTLATHAEVLERLGEKDRARTLFEEAANEIELSRSYLERDDLKVAFLSGKQAVFEALAKMALEAPQSREPASSAAEAFVWCERSKARALIDLLSSHVSGISGHGDQSLLNRVRRLHEELNSRHVRSTAETRLVQSRVPNPDVDLKENELSKILGELTEADPEYVSLQRISVTSLQTIQRLLPENTTLVEYFSIRDEIVAFVINSRRAEVFRRLCPASRVQHLYECLTFQLDCVRLGREYVKAHEQQLTASTQRHLHELYRALVAPIRDRMDTTELIVVPHGAIHYLPFHALFDGVKYLWDSYAISYAPSASVLKYCLEKPDVSGIAPVLISVPDRNAPQIRAEVAELQSIFPQARRLEGRKATRRMFRREVTSADFVHIATHAVFRKDNPMFSAFKLGDGWVSALDLYAMSCEANLVTLSGCSSGMQQVAGGDDLLGLVRGFLYAGARSLLMSLWPVSDESTALLMKYFYNNRREGLPKAVALQSAAIRLRDEFPHPFFWAPFLLIGKP